MAKQTRVGQQLEDSELERKRKDDAKNQLKELFKQINKGKGGNQSTENKETVQVYAEPELTHLGVGYSFSQNHVEANDHSYTHNQLDLPNQKPTEELPV